MLDRGSVHMAVQVQRRISKHLNAASLDGVHLSLDGKRARARKNDRIAQNAHVARLVLFTGTGGIHIQVVVAANIVVALQHDCQASHCSAIQKNIIVFEVTVVQPGLRLMVRGNVIVLQRQRLGRRIVRVARFSIVVVVTRGRVASIDCKVTQMNRTGICRPRADAIRRLCRSEVLFDDNGVIAKFIIRRYG